MVDSQELGRRLPSELAHPAIPHMSPTVLPAVVSTLEV
jgi:hypothetical protein